MGLVAQDEERLSSVRAGRATGDEMLRLLSWSNSFEATTFTTDSGAGENRVEHQILSSPKTQMFSVGLDTGRIPALRGGMAWAKTGLESRPAMGMLEPNFAANPKVATYQRDKVYADKGRVTQGGYLSKPQYEGEYSHIKIAVGTRNGETRARSEEHTS